MGRAPWRCVVPSSACLDLRPRGRERSGPREAAQHLAELVRRREQRQVPLALEDVRTAFDGGRLTSDAGVLVLAEVERRLGIAERLARCLADPRAPERVHHTVIEMIRFRVLLIAAGYADANDCGPRPWEWRVR